MAKVTDKDYYLDDNLKRELDFMFKRSEKQWDNVIVIDGEEGSGKSTFGQAIGYYYMSLSGKVFTNANIFFKTEDMQEFAEQNKDQVIIFDEAALAAMSNDWFNKEQRNLIKLLMTIRKNRHLWVFILPSFFKLKDYIAVDRSVCLLHCYSPDMITRGHFTFYNRKQKRFLYFNDTTRKYRNYGKNPSFNGRYTKTDYLINQDEYDRRKDEAINSIGKDNDKQKDKLHQLMGLISTIPDYYNISQEELAKHFDVKRQTIYNWKKHTKGQ